MKSEHIINLEQFSSGTIYWKEIPENVKCYAIKSVWMKTPMINTQFAYRLEISLGGLNVAGTINGRITKDSIIIPNKGLFYMEYNRATDDDKILVGGNKLSTVEIRLLNMDGSRATVQGDSQIIIVLQIWTFKTDYI